jgi:hypothetical protein
MSLGCAKTAPLHRRWIGEDPTRGVKFASLMTLVI